MNLVKFNFEEHGKVMNDWLTHYKWSSLPEAALPKVGYMAMHDDVPVCTGFLYKTDSVIGIFEWIIGNPALHHSVRGVAIEKLIEQIKKDAKEAGCIVVMCFTGNKRFIDKCEKTGFKITDVGMTHGMWTV